MFCQQILCTQTNTNYCAFHFINKYYEKCLLLFEENGHHLKWNHSKSVGNQSRRQVQLTVWRELLSCLAEHTLILIRLSLIVAAQDESETQRHPVFAPCATRAEIKSNENQTQTNICGQLFEIGQRCRNTFDFYESLCSAIVFNFRIKILFIVFRCLLAQIAIRQRAFEKCTESSNFYCKIYLSPKCFPFNFISLYDCKKHSVHFM